MKRILASIFLFKSLCLFSQTIDPHLLFSNTYKLYKYTRGKSDENIYEAPHFTKNRKNEILEVKICSAYTSNLQNYFVTNGFKQIDTLSIVEWDIMKHNGTMFKRICKVKYLERDTCLLFYGEKIMESLNNIHFDKKTYITPRKFKILKCTNKEVVLQDMDAKDLRRVYYFNSTNSKKK